MFLLTLITTDYRCVCITKRSAGIIGIMKLEITVTKKLTEPWADLPKVKIRSCSKVWPFLSSTNS
jgi:hypothetical protein